MTSLNPTERYAHLTNRQITDALRSQYRQSAVNEMLVAGLRFEMSNRKHNHKWLSGQRFTGKRIADYGSRECAWCFYGTDEYTMGWEQIVERVRESERVSDEAISGVLRISTGKGWA